MVGIGASAGGLDALEKLFSAMPADSGLAFVVVQHLDARHPSLLADLLARRTRIPVSQVEDGARPEPDHVYVIAPGTLLTMGGGVLRVAPSPEDTSVGRIDAFLSSLAKDRGESAVGVILSGAGADGLVGLRAIRDGGGLVLAQDPETAAHGSMPRTAIQAGLADQVLALEQIPPALVAYARHLASAGAAGAGLDAELAGSLHAICALLQQRTGHDFSRYKEGTLVRRIRRRVHVQRAASAADYVRLLEEDPAEPQRLLKDLLIGVTQFFRDPEAFTVLAREVLPRIVAGKPPDSPIRIWVPGCASGEEAYSIAMLVHEHLASENIRRFVQIFATDLDSEMIAEARAGRYPAEIADQVSPERLDRFFVREGSAWRVGLELREMCIFSVHSLIRDPPFSSLDLVSCRNVLIYLEPDLQKQILPLFHYALRSGGFLILGPAEAISNHAELFETVDKKRRVFRRKETLARPQVEFPLSTSAVRRFDVPTPGAAPAPTPRQRATTAIERMLLDDYAPPCAVVDARGDIQFVAGHIGRYLAPPAGAPTTNLLDAVRDSLRRELRAALHGAAASGGRIVRDGVPVELEDAVHRLRLTVRPVPGAQGLFAVLMQERALEEVESLEEVHASATPPALEQVESELRTTRAELKAAIESAEAANEELRSANEELISTNEELQSTNEEMQTSKEELQSLNEELETVNAELQRKVDELGVANGDLRNLFASTEIATVFLDRDLRITRFTPAATALLHLIEGDVGRPLVDFAPRFDGQDLVADAREVLRTLAPLERQVHAAVPGGWFILRAFPYRTVENAVAGVVVTFIDVSELKRAEAALRESEERYSVIHDRAPFAIALTRMPEVTFASVNEAFVKMFEFRREELLGRTSVELGISDPEAHALVAEEFRRRGSVRDFEVTRRTRSGAEVVLSLNFDPVTIRGEEYTLSCIQDVTARKRAEEALERSRAGLSRLAEASLSVMRETDLRRMLQAISEAALTLTGARLATCGHGYIAGQFRVGGSARAAGAPTCPPGDMFAVDKGGVHLELTEGAEAIRLTDAELRAHPRWWGVPEAHVPLRGLLGVRMAGSSGRTSGVVLVTDKERGEFTEEDESLLRQLATIASLALQHVEARISLEESDRSKNHFLAILSHELRNPLAPIRNSVHVLKHVEPGGEQARRAQEVIDRQAQHLTRLVDDLLDVTRISRGKVHLRRERLDLGEVVRRAAEDHRASFANGGVGLEVSVPGLPVWIFADRTRIAQVVGNLLENAVKFSERGGKASVAVEENTVLRQGVVRVRDTGVGIAADVLPRVFEPFMQADTTLDRSKGGLGLGLALVKGLVEMHHGTASVESEGLGKGAEFTVRLRLEDPASAPAPEAGSPASTASRRVLVIDDNVDAAESLREVLQLGGHVVEVASSGTEGIEKARAFEPDVVLCDIGLPGMDGYEVARALRADPARRGTRLVALTGYAAPDDLARSSEAGFDTHVAKPATLAALEEALS